MGENMLNFDSFRRNYGTDLVADMKNYWTCYTKYAKQKNRRSFLLRCRSEELKPSFLNIKTNHFKFYSTDLGEKFEEQVVKKFQVSTLNLLISDTISNIEYLENRISFFKHKIKNALPDSVSNTFFQDQTKKYETLFKQIKEKHIKKIEILLKVKNRYRANANSGLKFLPEWIENLTNIQLPDYVVEILSLGPNFAMPFTEKDNLPIIDIISNIEVSINKFTVETKDQMRASCCNFLTNHKHNNNLAKNQNKNLYKNLIKNLNKTKKFLKEHPNIKILKPDKSNKTVIMCENIYDNKMTELLNDDSTYKEIRSDPTNIHQKKNNELIKKWETNNYISPATAKNLTIHNALIPKIYGLPKLHKNGIPMRPIVSCVQSPFSNLAKFLKNILSNVVNKNESYIKDSWQFKDKIKNIDIPKNYSIISLDVVSLYTNIPTNRALHLIEKKWDEIKKFTDIPLNEFKQAVSLTLNSTYFMYKDKYFKQIDGCAMGSSISSVVAQLVLEDLENTVIPSLDFNLPFFYRYVDDCLTAIPKGKEDYILKMFHTYDKKIKFTIETEENNKINFLDMTIHHHQGKNILETEWYTKKTWSGRYLNYFSQHPTSQKKTVIMGLADRAIKLSDAAYRDNAINKAKDILKTNSYPIKLINQIFKTRLHKFQNATNNTNQQHQLQQQKNFISLPYINGLSENFQKYFKTHNINVCHKASNLLQSHYSRLKTKTPKNKKSHTVYEIPCSNCDGVYIGQTSQYLGNRLNGHKYDKKNHTALTKHALEHNHTFNYQETKILKTEINTQKREICEMIYIKKNSNAINAKTDIKNLSKIYFNVV